MTVEQRKAHAFHEAGHVVVALATEKIKVCEVHCEDTGGTTKVEWLEADMNFEKVCFYIAGEIAEFSFSEKNYSERNSTSDRANTQNVLFLISHNRNEQYTYWLLAIQKVRKIFSEEKHANFIQKIAEALIKKDMLTEEEIRAIMQE